VSVKIPVVIVLLLGLVAGYVLGTEHGRAQRDIVLVKLGRTQADEPTESPASEGSNETA